MRGYGAALLKICFPKPRFSQTTGAFPYATRAAMAFKLVHAKYDRETERAYVEVRDEDEGGEVLAVAVFSFRTTSRLSKQQIEQEIVRKARHLFKRAATSI
jgi:hypothetical protein